MRTLISGPKVPKNAEKSVFPFKNRGQGQRFGLKTILFDHVIGFYSPKDFSINFNNISPLTGSSRPSFRARECPKISISLQKTRLKDNDLD